MEETHYHLILVLPIVILLICSSIFLINIVRVLITKLHPKSSQPAPLAVKKAVRATLILVRSKTDFKFPYFLTKNIFLDSSVWFTTHFTTISTRQKFFFWISLSAFFCDLNKPARILRFISFLFCKSWSHHSCFPLPQHFVSKNF